MKSLHKSHRKGIMFLMVAFALVISMSITALAALYSSPGNELTFNGGGTRNYGTKGTVYVESTIGAYAGNTMRTSDGKSVPGGYLGTTAALCDANGNIILFSPMSTNSASANTISTVTNYRSVRGTYSAQGCGDFWNGSANITGISPRTPNLTYQED